MAFDFIEKHSLLLLVCWFLFRFPQITYAKTQFFFLAASFPNKAFVFPNNRISEACICRQSWFRKTYISACVISRKQKTEQLKKLHGNVFPQVLPVKSKVTRKNLAHLEAKQISLKSHLGYLCPFNSRAHDLTN